MLLRGNICYIEEGLGVVGEKVFVEYFAYAQQEVGVDGRLVEEALHGAALYAQLVGEPLVGVARAAQFVADEVAYVYLHSGCCLRVGYRSPYLLSDDHRQKRRRAISSPMCGRRKNLFKERQNTRLSASTCFLLSLKP